MSVLHARDVTPEQAGFLLDIALAHLLLFAEFAEAPAGPFQIVPYAYPSVTERKKSCLSGADPTPSPFFQKDVIPKDLSRRVCKRCDSKGVTANHDRQPLLRKPR